MSEKISVVLYFGNARDVPDAIIDALPGRRRAAPRTRVCACGVVLEKRRKLCDKCRAETRANTWYARHREYALAARRAYRERQARV